MAPKKNVRKVPLRVTKALERIKENSLVAGCAKIFSRDEIASGKLAHLGVELSSDGLKFPAEAPISPLNGKYSYRNTHGQEIVCRHLPKETHYNVVETPNWGNNGTHTVHLPYEKYPRDFIAPANVALTIDVTDASPGLAQYIVRFRLSEVLNRHDPSFEARLLANLNLLQEAIGHCEVHSAETPTSAYLQALNVSWDILPPGTLDEAMARLFHGRSPSTEEHNTVQERYEFFMGLKPEKLVYGNSGFERYFGAMIQSDLVVFENVRYGNAVYVMFGPWQELSKRSRIDLISGRCGNNFERVVHSPHWKERVKSAVRAKIGAPSN